MHSSLLTSAFVILLAVPACRRVAAPVVNDTHPHIDAGIRLLDVSHIDTHAFDVTHHSIIARVPDAGVSPDAVDAGLPVVHWTLPPAYHPPVVPPTLVATVDAGTNGSTLAGGDAAVPPDRQVYVTHEVLVPVDGGALAFWTQNVGDDTTTLLLARRIDANGNFVNPPRRIARFTSEVTALDADGFGTGAWVAWRLRTAAQVSLLEAAEVRADLTGVSNALTLSRLRGVDVDQFDVRLTATDTGGAYVFFAGKHHIVTEEEIERMMANSDGMGGAPSGNPTETWSLVELLPNHVVVHTRDITDEVYDPEHENEGEESSLVPTLARVPGGVRFGVTWPGTNEAVDWLAPGIEAPCQTATVEGTPSDIAWLWTGDDLLMIAGSADAPPLADAGDAGPRNRGMVLALKSIHPVASADAGVRNWHGGSVQRGALENVEIHCTSGHPVVDLQWEGGSARMDLSRHDVFGEVGRVVLQTDIPGGEHGNALVWTGGALVSLKDAQIMRWTCPTSDGPLVAGSP